MISRRQFLAGSMTVTLLGSPLFSALKSKTNQTVAARHLAKYYTGPCKYDAVSVDNSEFFAGVSAFGAYVTSLPESTAVIDTYIDKDKLIHYY